MQNSPSQTSNNSELAGPAIQLNTLTFHKLCDLYALLT